MQILEYKTIEIFECYMLEWCIGILKKNRILKYWDIEVSIHFSENSQTLKLKTSLTVLKMTNL